MTLSPGLPRDPLPDLLDNAKTAARRRRRLMIVLAATAAAIVVAAIIALVLPGWLRHDDLVATCIVMVYLGGLPLLASMLQFLVIGLNRFSIGYDQLSPCYPRVAILVPAWNEGNVIGATIERLLAMEYPRDHVRVYVVDDASTDATPDVVKAWEAREPGRVRHLRREKGGQGKAHTLNHGIAEVLAEPWAEALLVIDADVLFEPTALRRMARHLSNPDVGAVTAYIKEGSANGNYLTRLIAYEYVTAQAAARRAQNVFGVMACLAGGAQLHSRQNLETIGGRIDTSSLAEDTLTTFRTQLSGKSVVFDGNAVVWAEEPGDLDGLWKQRLRWARGNVQISLQFSHMWLHGRRYGGLGQSLFALIWFTVLLMPVTMLAASTGLIGLWAIDAHRAWHAFRLLWIFHAIVYVFVTAMALALDPATARRAWLQGILFPGVISLAMMTYGVAPGPIGALLTAGLEHVGVAVTPARIEALQLFQYTWLTGSMAVAYFARWLSGRWRLEWLPKLLVYIAGFGALLCAVTVAAYVREIQGAGLAWDKTVKTGRVVIPQ
jgi:cellulose synthase/poly-beta-1,6-N-acetylglucosamine synthase-like glycosyltransferase